MLPYVCRQSLHLAAKGVMLFDFGRPSKGSHFLKRLPLLRLREWGVFLTGFNEALAAFLFHPVPSPMNKLLLISLPRSLSLDFGDGRGYRPVVWDQPIATTYATAGTKRVRVRVLQV